MLSNDVLVDVALSLRRADLEALLLTDYTCRQLVEGCLLEKGPLRHVTNAIADGSALLCLTFADERSPDDVEDFVHHLRNCYVENLSLHGDVFDGVHVDMLVSLKGAYFINSLQLRSVYL